MKQLVVGFDSAWAGHNRGAIVGAILRDDRAWEELGDPAAANFDEAADTIRAWQNEHVPDSTIIFLDQPTIVANATGQRPVENVVASPVSRRYSAVQPSSRQRADLFGDNAPVWGFLSTFGGAVNNFNTNPIHGVIETYPVLALIALGWTLPDETGGRPTGRLPRYKPGTRNFRLTDWKFVCNQAAHWLRQQGLERIPDRLSLLADLDSPSPAHQDEVDACLCLIVAMDFAAGRPCLLVGQTASGYMVVPASEHLQMELVGRCRDTGRNPNDWVVELN